MKIQQEETPTSGRHFINDEDGNMVAEITYTVKHPHKMIIDHTEVAEKLQGKNIGQQLVESVVEQARAEGRKIIPVCTFAKAIMERKKEFGDVLSED